MKKGTHPVKRTKLVFGAKHVTFQLADVSMPRKLARASLPWSPA
jgi:hypothetical protein